MAKSSVRRFRRSAAQLHALVSVERTISETDTISRCRYLRDYAAAFQNYESVLSPRELHSALRQADIVLIGDYHALSASQAYAASILEQISLVTRRPVIFCLEAVLARDQKIVDEWFRGEIDVEELRDRIRFDLDWGYDWRPYRELLERARRITAGVYGIDCPPRNSMRNIARRDRHAATKISELRRAHPDAIVAVLFGESHLAPNHLPGLIRTEQPKERILTVLQNVDSLYWQAAGEPGECVDAVRVTNDVVCAFTSTPLEKYENYRLYIEQWRRERTSVPDMAPSFYNLIETIFRFLNLNRGEVAFSADNFPEVSSAVGTQNIRRRLQRIGQQPSEIQATLLAVRERGSCYVPAADTIFARRFLMPEAAEEAARFVHHACQGVPQALSMGSDTTSIEDEFYGQVIHESVAYLGSKILCPTRVVTCVSNASTRLGQMLASRIYDAYVAGRVSKRFLRSVFCTPIDKPGAARALYFNAAGQVSPTRVQLPLSFSRLEQVVS